MSGSRLGRGRGGRLAVYGGCGVVVVLLFFLYRAATSEMARLRELHVQCAHQQEALAAQLQVIFEYKVRLEKSLAEEKSSNAAVKQELQQRATREKSLRDKDSIEAMQRFNSLQQTYKLLQTEHQDLLEECKKREKQALEDTNRLETTLQDLRSRIRQAREDKEKSLQHLKSRYLELDIEKTKLEEKWNDMLKTNSNSDSTIDHLKKEVFQLQRELEEAKKSLRKATSPGPNPVSPQSSQRADQVPAKSGDQGSVSQPIGPSPQQQQQVSRPNNDNETPQPLHAPRKHHAIGDPLSNERMNEDANEINEAQFAQKDGNIVPVGPNDVKDTDQKDLLPFPYKFRERQEKEHRQDQLADDLQLENNEKEENQEEEQQRQVIPPPNDINEKPESKKTSSKSPRNEIPSWKQSIALARPVEKVSTELNSAQKVEKAAEKAAEDDDELQKLQDEVNGILNHI